MQARLILEQMKIFRILLLVGLLAVLVSADSSDPLPPLPLAITNNAIAVYNTRGHDFLFSIMGMGQGKTWDAVSNKAYMLDSDNEEWVAIPPVPGVAGRVSAMAAAVNEQVYVFGGAVVDAQKQENIVSEVNVFDRASLKWYRQKDIPVPVADSVVGIYRDRFIYLIGGRSDSGPVSTVQVYDTDHDKWFQATPMPYAVFGHAGAMVEDTMLYIDGASANPGGKPIFLPAEQCWLGKVNHKDPSRIEWSSVPEHPGDARFRIAAGASEKDNKIYFSGGSNTPYSDNGIAYNGTPAQPSAVTFDYDLREKKWEVINQHTPNPRMDAHNIIVTRDGLLLIGGMEDGQKVTARAAFIRKETPQNDQTPKTDQAPKSQGAKPVAH